MLIFGTEGFWKFLNNEIVMNIVLPYYENNDIEGAVQKLKETVLYIYKMKIRKYIDNIIVFILFFK